MSGIPTVKVEMDTPAGALGWVDITTYVPMEEGIRCSRGRSNEFETSAPGTASFRIADTGTGDWAPGGVFSDVGYGLMRKNARVRFTVAGVQVWQGRVDSFRITPGDVMDLPLIQVDCTDEFKTYAKARLYPFALETCRVDGSWTGGAVYPLSAVNAGGTVWAAHRNAAASPMTLVTSDDGGNYELNDDGPPHVKSAIRITTLGAPAGVEGPVLEHPTTWDPGSQYGLASVWFRSEITTNNRRLFHMFRTSGGTGYVEIVLVASTGAITFKVVGDGGATATLTTTSPYVDLNDGAWHHVAAWFHPGSGTTIRAYIDGNLYGTANSGGTACTIGSGNRRATFGGQRNAAWTNNTDCLNGDLALPAVFLRGSTTDVVAQWYDDGMTGDTNTTVAIQSAAFASFVGATAPTTANLSGYQIAGQDISDSSFLSAVQRIADSELGVFYIDRLNAPRLRGYGARSTGASVVVTLSATADLHDECALVLDDATYANTVRATSENGSAVAQDSALVTADGAEVVDEWATLTYSQSDLSTMATNRLNLRKSNVFRLGRIKADLLTAQNAIESATLQLVPLDRVRVSDLDSTMFGATTYDGFVEGWELTVSLDEYTVDLDLSPVV